MDRTKAMKIRKRMIELLSAVEDEFGVLLDNNGGRYSDEEYSLKVTFRENSVAPKLQQDYEYAMLRDNLKPFGSKIKINYSSHAGEELTIIGWKPKSYKYPLIVQATDGTKFKLPAREARL